MKLIPLTQGMFAKVDDEDYEEIVKFKWQFDGRYASRNRNDGSGKRIGMHQQINVTPNELVTDHINRDQLDNQRSNLRSVTKAQNMMNSRKRSGSSSRFRGVCWDKFTNRWMASTRIGRKNHHIGRFDSEEDAAKAYDQYVSDNPTLSPFMTRNFNG